MTRSHFFAASGSGSSMSPPTVMVSLPLIHHSFALAKDVMQVSYAKDNAKSGADEEDYTGKLWKTA